jgi:tetratricopeptide (TPR) repeat protein
VIEPLLAAERAMSVGLLDRAESLYRQVATADPRNSIAVVGLARVALDRGDEEAALELSRRALTIDPENAAAVRMVARLEEVMVFRGDEVPLPRDGVWAEELGPDQESEELAGADEAEPAANVPDETEASAEAVDTILPSDPAQQARAGPDGGAPASPHHDPEPDTVRLEPMTPEGEQVGTATPPASAGAPKERSWVDRLIRRIGW